MNKDNIPLGVVDFLDSLQDSVYDTPVHQKFRQFTTVPDFAGFSLKDTSNYIETGCFSMTLANRILISAGVGFLTITDRHMEQFNTLLLDYYNTGDSDALTDFLYENTIQGIT